MTWQKYPLKVGHHVLSYIHYKWATRKAPDWQGLYFWFPFAAWGQSFLQIQLYPGISSHGLQRVIWVKKERKKKKKISSISSASSLCVSLQVHAGASSDHSAAKVAKHLPLWLCFQCFRVFGKKSPIRLEFFVSWWLSKIMASPKCWAKPFQQFLLSYVRVKKTSENPSCSREKNHTHTHNPALSKWQNKCF